MTADGWPSSGTAREDARELAYLLTLRIPSGQPVEMRTLAYVNGGDEKRLCSSYLPPLYYIAEDYLDRCAAAVNAGEPAGRNCGRWRRSGGLCCRTASAC